ncbi:MAG TPA: hypothetical protein VG713_10835 [Pirellulales bacterium]|nr:hypothetical protein [Pirellulales bacterium]
MKRGFAAWGLAAVLVAGCNPNPPSGDVRSQRDAGSASSETRPGGDTTGIGTGAGGTGSGPTGTGGTQPADNEAVESNTNR